ncbi:MAG: sodium/solute symporter [bacterium]
MDDAGVGITRTGDLIALVTYFVATLGLGLWFSIKTKTTEGYFLGGRKMPGWAVGLSMLGTAISSITFLAYPGSAYDGNYSRIVPGLAFPIGAIFAIWIFIRFYRETGYISAYTYFERRFGLWGRIYVCILFSLGQIWRMGLVLYLLSIAITSMYPTFDLRLMIIVIGAFVTVYTVLGGIEAVVWTDVFQTIVLILGGFSVILVVFMNVDGGAATVFQMGSEAHKFSFVGHEAKSAFDLSFARDTLLMLLLTGVIGSSQEFALDQTKIQRYCATSTIGAARRAALTGAVGCIPVWLLFMFVGTCLWVFYQVHPDLMHRELLADEVFPYFIVHQLPDGFGGVVIAGVLAAAMSTISSSMSATSNVVSEDIYKRLLVRGRDDYYYLKVAKIIAFLGGVGMFAVALWLTLLRQETILEICFIIGAMLAGGIGGFFFIGFCTTRANNFGAAVGIVLAVLATFGMVFIEAKAMMWESRVSWLTEAAVENGDVDAEAIRAEICAQAQADGITLRLADVKKKEKEQVRNLLANRIRLELGEQPPHLGDAIGVHPFAMGLVTNFLALIAGYLFSFFRPAQSLEKIGGLTWWTRHMKRIEP